MATNSDNLFTDGFRGTVGGNMTFRRKKSGKVVVSKCRKASDIPPTAGQLETQSRFKRSIIYAKAIIKDAASLLLYGNAAKGDQTAYNVAVKDAFTAPTVTTVDASDYDGSVGDKILIQATDDFKVVSVKVSVKDLAGVLIEESDAVLAINGLDWLFTASKQNGQVAGSVIKVTAFDYAGNEGSLEITL